MSKAYLVKLSICIPVLAESPEEAREYLNENHDAARAALEAVLASCVNEDEPVFTDSEETFEVTDELLEENPHYRDLVPCNDDEFNLGELLAEEEYTEEDDAEDAWSEPAHEDD